MVTSPLEFKTSVSNTLSPGGRPVGCIAPELGSSSELAPKINAPRAR